MDLPYRYRPMHSFKTTKYKAHRHPHLRNWKWTARASSFKSSNLFFFFYSFSLSILGPMQLITYTNTKSILLLPKTFFLFLFDLIYYWTDVHFTLHVGGEMDLFERRNWIGWAIINFYDRIRIAEDWRNPSQHCCRDSNSLKLQAFGQVFEILFLSWDNNGKLRYKPTDFLFIFNG